MKYKLRQDQRYYINVKILLFFTGLFLLGFFLPEVLTFAVELGTWLGDKL